MTTAFAYVRVSSLAQEKEGFSIPSQIDLVREYAARISVDLQEIFQDVMSAGEEGRPEFTALVKKMRSIKGRRIVLVENTDRLTRNSSDWERLVRLGCEIHLIREGRIHSPNTSAAEAYSQDMILANAKHYLRNLSEQARKGMTQKAKHGMYPSFAPLGYVNQQSATGRKEIVPDEQRAPLIEQLFEWAASGNHSLLEMSRMARSAGLAFRGSGDALPKSSIHKILRNPVYSGRFKWKGEEYEGNYPAIISRELWLQAQDALDGKRRFSTRVRRQFTYGGLMTCANCGCAVVAEIKKERYVYYHCTKGRGQCKPRRFTEKEITQLFEQELTLLGEQCAASDLITTLIESASTAGDADVTEKIRRLEREIRNAETRLDRMYGDRLDEVITPEEYTRRASGLKDLVTTLKRELAAVRATRELNTDFTVGAMEMLHELGQRFRFLDGERRRQVVELIFRACRLHKDGLRVELHAPFSWLQPRYAA